MSAKGEICVRKCIYRPPLITGAHPRVPEDSQDPGPGAGQLVLPRRQRGAAPPHPLHSATAQGQGWL